MADRTLDDIEAEARRLIREHLGPHVQFGWDNASRRAGVCQFRATKLGRTITSWSVKRISLSRPIFELTERARAEATDVILHEIAHGLAGPAANHGWEWKVQARKLGCSGDRCHTFDVPSSGITRYCTEECKENGAESSRTRIPNKPRRCLTCRSVIRFEQQRPARTTVVAAASRPVDPDLAARRSAAARKAVATRRARAAARSV